VVSLACFHNDLALPHDRLELCSIPEDFPNNIDSTGRHDLARLAHGGLAKENTPCLTRGPVAQITEFDYFLRAIVQVGVDRNGEVDFIAPGVERSAQGQRRSDFLSGRGLVQFRLHGERADSYSNAHGYPPFLVSDYRLLQHLRVFDVKPLLVALRRIDAMPVLLAVDIGVKTGLALYGHDGRLLWYRSQNFGTAQRLRRGVRHVLDALPHLAWLVLEGGGPLADIWRREATRRQIPVRQISAEAWRQQFLYAREQRSGTQAKERATELARRIIIWSGARRRTSLRDDAAEAILIGLWGTLDVGWLAELPEAVRR
jgi:hypothetical protein